jgi:Spy/CpxP family protein refolding chaperone
MTPVRSNIFRAVLIGLNCFCVAATVSAQDDTNWELFLNRAVQKDLNLSPEQQAQTDKLIKDLQEATEWMTARGDGKDKERYYKQFVEELDKHGPRFMKLLKPEQQERFRQIELQAIGRDRAFLLERVQKSLQLTEKQTAEFDRIIAAAQAEFKKLAVDVSLDVNTLKERFERGKQDVLARELAVLTDQQRQKFEALFGKPFDLELLENASGVKPRALTVVFPSRGRSATFLLGSKETQQALGLTGDQVSRLTEIIDRSNRELTAVRLGILKKGDKDFRDLSEDDKRKTAKKILADAEPIRQAATQDVRKVLTPEQADKFDDQAIKIFGPRAIEADAIAARLKLTDDQKAAFAKLIAEFDDATAPLIVVRRQTDLDKKYDAAMKKLDTDIFAILTPDQRKMLEAKAK